MNARTLEDDFEDLLALAYRTAYGRPPEDRWLSALALRSGTKGAVATLEEAGDAAGVTRERVRQVMGRVAPLLHGRPVPPRLEEAATALAAAAPVPEPVGQTLVADGLARAGLTGEAFLNMLSLLGTTPEQVAGVDLAAVPGWLVTPGRTTVLRALGEASKQTSKFGMTTPEDIAAALDTALDAVSAADVERVLRVAPGVRWHDGWLWVDKAGDQLHANRLVNKTRAILSVNAPQSVQSVHEGVRRWWKFRRLALLPPTGAMKAFFEDSPYFTVHGDQVAPTEPLDYHAVLGEVSASMVDVLKSSPYQVMDRRSFEEACEAAGIAHGTYKTWTTFAEWMERFAPGVWGLRGSRPNPAAVKVIQDAARTRAAAEPHRRTWAWGRGGQFVQTMDVTTSVVTGGVIVFDGEVAGLLAGQPVPVAGSNGVLGTVKFGLNHSFSWGWFPVLRALGVRAGSVLQVEIDLSRKTAHARSGGQELWDAP